MDPELLLDLTLLVTDGVQRSPSGGLRIPARPTRTGVLTYLRADGSVSREYRPPEEVFAPASLSSLAGAPVTIGHPASGAVTPADWAALSVGHVGDSAQQDGRFVGTAVYVQDAGAVARVGAKELVELSAGYYRRLDRTPGVTPEGEHYDGVQRDIRYNHVALLPRGAGRAGSEVRLRTDSACAIVEAETELPVNRSDGRMTLEEALKKIGEHEARIGELTARCDSLTGERDQARAEASQARNDSADSVIEGRVKARLALVADAAAVLGAEFVADGKSETEILRAMVPDAPADASVDYLRGFASAAVKSAKAAADGNAKLRVDSKTPAAPIKSAREEMLEKNRGAFGAKDGAK